MNEPTARHSPFARVLLVPIIAVSGTYFFSTGGTDGIKEIYHGYRDFGARFAIVNSSTPFLEILFPTLFFGGIICLAMELNPSPCRLLRAAVICLLSLLYTVYICYRLFCTLNLDTIPDAVFSILFFLAEFLVWLKALSANLQMFWPSNRTPGASRLSELITTGQFLPSIDLSSELQ